MVLEEPKAIISFQLSQTDQDFIKSFGGDTRADSLRRALNAARDYKAIRAVKIESIRDMMVEWELTPSDLGYESTASFDLVVDLLRSFRGAYKDHGRQGLVGAVFKAFKVYSVENRGGVNKPPQNSQIENTLTAVKGSIESEVQK
jgi:hypothetical protein